jgi:hypothetical protein
MSEVEVVHVARLGRALIVSSRCPGLSMEESLIQRQVKGTFIRSFPGCPTLI